jgi:hypothetical protein
MIDKFGVQHSLIAAVLLALSFLGCTENQPNTSKTALEIKVLPLEDPFLASNNFHNVKIVFKNVSQNVIWLNKAFNFSEALCELTYDAISPSGKAIPDPHLLDPRRGDLNRSDFIKIMPGNTYETVENIKKLYGYAKELGVYKLTVFYKNLHRGEEFGLNAWVGETKSEPIAFEVAKD